MSSNNYCLLLQSMNASFSCLNWLICVTVAHRGVRGLLKDAPLGMRKVERLPLSPSYWDRISEGLSSGSFKWGLVTAGTSWTKLLLPAPLLCCSHSPLIGFDCICLNPQWKKEKGGWRGCSETEVCQFVQTRWHFRKKKGLPLPGLIKQRLGVWCLVGHKAGVVVKQANPGLYLHMHNHLWWSQLISSVSGSTYTVYAGAWTPT